MNAQEKVQCVELFIETKLDIIWQRRFRTPSGRQPPSRNIIQAWYYIFMSTGSM